MQARRSVARFNWEGGSGGGRRDDGEVASYIGSQRGSLRYKYRGPWALFGTPAANWSNFASSSGDCLPSRGREEEGLTRVKPLKRPFLAPDENSNYRGTGEDTATWKSRFSRCPRLRFYVFNDWPRDRPFLETTASRRGGFYE